MAGDVWTRRPAAKQGLRHVTHSGPLDLPAAGTAPQFVRAFDCALQLTRLRAQVGPEQGASLQGAPTDGAGRGAGKCHWHLWGLRLI
ncbi:hypothetical protein AAFF_G00100890 [Aldrovandia affinis]|uniref:Uncharacterized protein n=1 Tax=Aldrovandia affinis TaxID=143900 RepID=A0AAD7RUN1_9TELE|nr:hypothetical protein AAFF_G00100890 [Aldrovandia affinis]